MDVKDRKIIFEKLFVAMYPKMKLFATGILKSEEEAEDAVQDVFAKLWVEPDILEKTASLENYLFIMVKNQIFNIIKHKAVEQSYQEEAALNLSDISDLNIYNNLYAKEMKLLLDMEIERMPEQRRNVFLLSRRDGKSNAEIAALLGLSVRTVERHIYLALQDLKKIILLIIVFLLSSISH